MTKRLTLPKASTPKWSKSTQSMSLPAHRVFKCAAGQKPAHAVRRVGQLLRSYRAGPLPKPFKIIPSLPAWARILALTAPEQWSPQATHAATRIFISNMKPPQARVFLEGVVLGLVRADLEQPSTRKDSRKLNPHLYEALKRALYKPAAFFKGIVFPLLDASGSLILMPVIDDLRCALRVVGRVHAQGGRHCRVCACESQGAAFAFFGRAHPSRRDGLLGYVCLPRYLARRPPTLLRTRYAHDREQGRRRSSSACCWTRSTRCRTRCSTRSSSTSSGSQTPMTPARSPYSGTRACSCSASATRRTSRRSKRTRCVTSCERIRMRRSRPRSGVSSPPRRREANPRRTRWMFRSMRAYVTVCHS